MNSYLRVLRGLLLIAVLVAVALLVDAGRLGGVLDRDWVDAEIRGQGLAGEARFIVTAALLASLGLPRQVVAFMAGYGFGFMSGTGLALMAIVAACMLSFSYGRGLAALTGHARVPGRLRSAANFIREHTFSSTVLIRLLPAGSNLLVNLAAGAARIRGLPFFTASALGYIPQTLIFALIGSGIKIDPGQRISVGILLFLISAWLGFRLYRKYRRENAMALETGRGV